MNKIIGVLIILGIFLSLSYAACKGDFCCKGEDSGYMYWTGNCADFEKDPSLIGKYCASGEWVDAAEIKCGCPSGYVVDTSKNEDGICIEGKVEKPKEEVKEETPKVEEPKEEPKKETQPKEVVVETTTQDLDTYYRYAPVNTIENNKGQGCGLATIMLLGIFGLFVLHKH